MRNLIRYVVVAIAASIPTTYIAVAAYMTLLPGSTGFTDVWLPAVLLSVGSLVPAAAIAALVGTGVVAARRVTTPPMSAFLVVLLALVGGVAFGWLATKDTPAIPTPLALWCGGIVWALVGAGVATRLLVAPN